MRAAAVGLDPWRVIDASAHPHDLAIAEVMVEQLEENEVARVKAQAVETAYRTVEFLMVALTGAKPTTD